MHISKLIDEAIKGIDITTKVARMMKKLHLGIPKAVLKATIDMMKKADYSVHISSVILSYD